jgi:hypothetical protein
MKTQLIAAVRLIKIPGQYVEFEGKLNVVGDFEPAEIAGMFWQTEALINNAGLKLPGRAHVTLREEPVVREKAHAVREMVAKPGKKERKKRNLSPEGRARIAAAMKKRWRIAKKNGKRKLT